MDRGEAIARLRAHETELRGLGVEHLYLFGSTARDEASEASDVDLFFDDSIGSIGFYQLMDIEEFAAAVLGSKTDVMTRRSLHPLIRDAIEASAVKVF